MRISSNRLTRKFYMLAVVSLVSVVLYSCSVSKEARHMKKNIKGDWVLETITAEGITGVTKSTVFNEAESGCFIGSEWHFVANNSMGSYSIVDKDKKCTPVKRLIRWSIYEPKGQAKEFQFKRLDDKKKPIDDGAGFRLSIDVLGSEKMSLRSAITFNGKPSALIFNFVKK